LEAVGAPGNVVESTDEGAAGTTAAIKKALGTRFLRSAVRHCGGSRQVSPHHDDGERWARIVDRKEVSVAPVQSLVDVGCADDVAVLGQVLHNWKLAQQHELIARAYDALPRGGAIVVYEALIDEERPDPPGAPPR
jgi:O-methyltransferase domain